MADTKIVNISGVAKPSRKMRRIATALHGANFAASIDTMLEDAKAVKILAGCIDRALVAAVTKDGRIDLDIAALTLIQELRRNQK